MPCIIAVVTAVAAFQHEGPFFVAKDHAVRITSGVARCGQLTCPDSTLPHSIVGPNGLWSQSREKTSRLMCTSIS